MQPPRWSGAAHELGHYKLHHIASMALSAAELPGLFSRPAVDKGLFYQGSGSLPAAPRRWRCLPVLPEFLSPASAHSLYSRKREFEATPMP